MYSDNLMMAKQRVPMVIEYFKHKPTGPDDNYIESVPMYINPQKLSISTQKVKGKAYTRGGIVYHHYGDDHFSMQLSGTVGLAGMKGIEVLQDIYHHSGALLRYQNVGPNKLGQFEGNYKTVDYNDPTGVLNYLVTNDLASDNQAMLFQQLEYARNGQSLASQRKMYDLVSYIASSYLNTLGIQTISTTYEDLQSKVQEYYNTYLRDNNNQTPSFENLYQYAQSIVNVDKNYGQIDNSTKVAIAFELVKPYYYDKFTSVDMNTIADIGTALDSDTIYSKIRDLTYSQADELSNYIQAVTDINSKNVIDRDSAFQGWSDIADELLDEWRPRKYLYIFKIEYILVILIHLVINKLLKLL
jgi:hypothetical protein